VSDAGWYPDPSGSGQLRYWDGERWSAVTRPAGPVGSSTQPAGASRSRHSRGPGILIGLVVLFVLIGLVALLLNRPWDRGFETTGDPATPTVSAWNDGESPTPTPSPSTSPTSTSAGPAPMVTCPSGDPGRRDDHPADGRVHGGGLSFAAIPSWQSRSFSQSWAYDVGSQWIDITGTWGNYNSVGGLSPDDGWGTPQHAADLISRCAITSDCALTDTRPVWSTATTISGRPAWSVRTDALCDVSPGIIGDVVQVIVVDLGHGRLAQFVATATIDHQPTLKAMTDSIRTLRVD